MEDRKELEELVIHRNKTQATLTKLELTIDEVLERYVGSLGLSQIVQVFLVSLAWIFDSQNTLVTIFSDAQPHSWRCKLDAGGGCSSNSSSSSSSSSSVCELVPGTWEWVGGNSSSILAEWGLICDRRFLAAVPASLFFLGSLLGMLRLSFIFSLQNGTEWLIAVTSYQSCWSSGDVYS